MELLYRVSDISQAEMGRLAGGIDYSAMSIARKRLRLRMESDTALKQQFEDVADKLSRIRGATFCPFQIIKIKDLIII
ncbi:MAG: hypothetical protein U5L07_09615 [Desulfobacterales bacterium]|nr:hypothetical protein [Desulfobacterales bacterium]